MKIPDYKISVIRVFTSDALRVPNRAKQKPNNVDYIDVVIETLEDLLDELEDMDADS